MRASQASQLSQVTMSAAELAHAHTEVKTVALRDALIEKLCAENDMLKQQIAR